MYVHCDPIPRVPTQSPACENIILIINKFTAFVDSVNNPFKTSVLKWNFNTICGCLGKSNVHGQQLHIPSDGLRGRLLFQNVIKLLCYLEAYCVAHLAILYL